MNKWMKALLIALAVVIVAACQRAPVTPTAVPEQPHIDCNLIFPAPTSQDPLAP